MGLDNSNPFPAGWIRTQLEIFAINPINDIVDGPFGSNLKANEYKEQGIPIIRLQNIDRNNFSKKTSNIFLKQKQTL